MAMNDEDQDPLSHELWELAREWEDMSLEDTRENEWPLRVRKRMLFPGERLHEQFERVEMEWEDFDVTDEVNLRRNVRPRLELEQDCIL